MFSPEQVRKYLGIVAPDHRFTDRQRQRMKCPIHQGHDKNFSVDMIRGSWTCHSRCGSGNLVQLEQRLHGGEREEATERLFSLIGVAPQYASKQIVCTYDYVDARGTLVAQKVRLEPKDFRWRVPVGSTGYTYCGPPSKPSLYGLLGVLTANVLMLAEGEKDADTLNSIKEWPTGSLGRVYATTSGAADTWRQELAIYAAGKKVIVFEHNDEKGRQYSQAVAESCFPVAVSIRYVRFEDLPEKGDVSDFVRDRGVPALLERIKDSPFWAPAADEHVQSTIVEGMRFATSGQIDTNWLIEGVLQAEGNGVIMGDPKAGKSLLLLHMILHLITGSPWFGCAIKERTKVGLVTREDAPGLTKKRLLRLITGHPLANKDDLENWLWINSREQTKTFDIQNEGEFKALVRDFRAQGCQIVFFDVFNRIHQLDENDNQAMSQITARLSQFGAEVGCQVGLIHHLNKDTSNANVFNRLRGAGALHGWMEWGLAVIVTNPNDEKKDWIRRVDLESKEVAVDSFHYRLEDGPGYLELPKTEPAATPAPKAYKPRAATGQTIDRSADWSN